MVQKLHRAAAADLSHGKTFSHIHTQIWSNCSDFVLNTYFFLFYCVFLNPFVLCLAFIFCMDLESENEAYLILIHISCAIEAIFHN